MAAPLMTPRARRLQSLTCGEEGGAVVSTCMLGEGGPIGPEARELTCGEEEGAVVSTCMLGKGEPIGPEARELTCNLS